MAIKYKIDSYKDCIQLAEVVKQTPKTYVQREDYFGKQRDFRHINQGSEKIYDTWADAHAALIKQLEDRVEVTYAHYCNAKTRLSKAMAMKESDNNEPA